MAPVGDPVSDSDVSGSEASTFQEALDDFKRHLKDTEKEDFQWTDFAGFKDAIQKIEGEQVSSNKIRNMKKLNTFLKSMEKYEKLIEVFLNTSEILAFVWGPLKFLLQVTRTYALAFDAILDMYKKIGDEIDIVLKCQALFQDQPHMRRVLGLIYKDILEFHAKALSYFRQKMWRTLLQSTWDKFRLRFAENIENFSRYRRLMESHATLVEFERTRDFIIQQTENSRLQRVDATRQQQIRVTAWLAAKNMAVQQEHHSNLRKEYPGTGRWLLEKRLVKQWLDVKSSSDSLICLTGIPGAGKTILASLLVDEMKNRSDAKVIFFYCKHQEQGRDSFLSIARSLLQQLSYGDDHFMEYLDQESSVSGETRLTSVSLAKRLLDTGIRNRENLFIIIDGLDECQKREKKEIVSWLRTPVESNTIAESCEGANGIGPTADEGVTRCLIVCQEDNDTWRLLKDIPTVKIQPEDNSADIQGFCQHWEDEILQQHNNRFHAINRGSIAPKVAKLSRGMFLFAKLVMRNLQAQLSIQNLRREIEWLEKGNPNEKFALKLNSVYERIIKRIVQDAEESYRDEALKILGWVVCAKRDLGWHEIQGAISLDVESHSCDFKERCLSVESKDLCGSLVEVKPGNVVALIHNSAKHYLVSKNIVPAVQSQLKFATICLSYLSLPYFDPLPQETVENHVLEGKYAFSDYAFAHWLDHLEDTISGLQKCDQADHSSSIDSLVTETRRFLKRHFSTVATRSIPGSFARRFNGFLPFQSYELAEELGQAAYAWNLFLAQQTKPDVDGNEKEMTDMLNLETAISQLRTSLDSVWQRPTSPATLEDLQSFHGMNLFKCAWVQCDYFHVGFGSSAERDTHQNKHRRAFHCTFEGCPKTIFGFPDLKSLEMHCIKVHQPQDAGASSTISVFPVTQAPTSINVKTAIMDGNLAAVQRWAEQFDGTIPDDKLGIVLEMGRGQIGALWKTTLGKQDLNMIRFLASKTDNISRIQIPLLNCILTTWSRNEELLEWVLSLPLVEDQRKLHGAMATHSLANKKDIAVRILRKFSVKRKNIEPIGAYSLLNLFARRGLLPCVRFLVDECGLDPNYTTPPRVTALMEAAERRYIEIVKCLVASRHCTHETIALESHKGNSAGLLAAANGHDAVIRTLFQGDNLSAEGQRYLDISQFRQAAIKGNLGTVRRSLDLEDFPIDLPDLDRCTPFLHAVGNGHTEIVGAFLTATGGRVDFNRTCRYRHLNFLVDDSFFRKSALIIATDNGHKDVVRLLDCNKIERTHKAWLRVKRDDDGFWKHLDAFDIAQEMKDTDMIAMFQTVEPWKSQPTPTSAASGVIMESPEIQDEDLESIRSEGLDGDSS